MDRREYILQSIKNRSAEIMPMNAKVILFGSQARGDYHEGSDWDILILLDKQKLSPSDFDEFAYPWKFIRCFIPLVIGNVEICFRFIRMF